MTFRISEDRDQWYGHFIIHKPCTGAEDYMDGETNFMACGKELFCPSCGEEVVIEPHAKGGAE